MQPRLIIFDFDGTLADTTATILATYQMAIKELNARPRTDSQCQATIGLPLKEGFRQLYPDFSECRLDTCVAVYRRIFNENKSSLRPALYPGVEETLREIDRLGIEMSVASSRSKASLVEFCRETKIENFFRLILGADEVERAKPHPEPVIKTLKALDVSPVQAVVVGDMPVDILMGRGAGCRTVGVTYGNSDRRGLVEAGADFIIDAFPELMGAVISPNR